MNKIYKAFSVKDYILSGGIKNITPYSNYDIYDYKNIAKTDGISENGNTCIITIKLDNMINFEIIYDENNLYISDQIEIDIRLLLKRRDYIIKRTNLFFLNEFKNTALKENINIIKEIKNKDEAILFLDNGINMHFLKSKKENDYLIMKITANSEKYRFAIENILNSKN